MSDYPYVIVYRAAPLLWLKNNLLVCLMISSKLNNINKVHILTIPLNKHDLTPFETLKYNTI